MKLVFSIIILGFFSLIVSAQNNINSYEYWFDNNYIDKNTGSLTGISVHFNETIDASALSDGVHAVHIRFKDDDDLWSSLVSQFFVKMPDVAGNVITTIEYWFDDAYGDKVQITDIGEASFNYVDIIDVSSFDNGIHSFHIRCKDNNDLWSSVVSQYFVKVPQIEIPNKITAYQYWFDDETYADVNDVTLPVPVHTFELSEIIDVSALSVGDHKMHIRFKDANQIWSSIVTDSFDRETITIADFSVADPTICFGDVATFNNTSQEATSYLWDFGDGDNSSEFEPTHFYEPGIYTVTLSVANSETGNTDVYIIENAVKVFQPEVTVLPVSATICEGEEIDLTASGAFTYVWSPATGLSSTTGAIVTASPVSSIVYNVTGTDTHGCQDNASRTVFVNPLPDAEISPAGTFDLCEGETLTLNTYPYDDFIWSTGETTASIEIDTEGEYTVTVANSCGIVTSEPVVVHLTNLPPEPAITIDGSGEICEGESVTLTSSIATGNVWNTG
ncbi:MAG: PKD domain-containing protein, partial [Chitinophagales bacterium]|nr:PKD domain-containing protein [Chitinophagales bacterium]